ncbi:MAG: hypothetical protein ACI4VF_03325 [Lachnospirales bacterium]
MNDEFNNNKDDEVVDSIPKGAKSIDEENNKPDNYRNNNGFNDFNNGSFRTRIIIENGPASLMAKIAFICSILSVILCMFPSISVIFALISAGLALINIANGNNGRVVCFFAIGISIFGVILAFFSSILWMIWHFIVGLIF